MRGAPVAELRISLPKHARASGLIIGVLAGIVGVACFLALFVTETESDLGAIGFFVFMALFGALLIAYSLYSIRVSIGGRAQLEIYPDVLVVRNDFVLRRPVEMHKTNIRVAAVDRGDPAFGGVKKQRFPVEDAAPPQFLFTPDRALLLPSVGDPNQVPDVLVLFDAPLQIGPRRPLMPQGQVIRGRYPSRHMERGFWVATEDAGPSTEWLLSLAPRRQANEADVAYLGPAVQTLPKQRWRAAVGLALTLTILGIRVATQGWDFFRDGDQVAPRASSSDGAPPHAGMCRELRRLANSLEPRRSPGRPPSFEDVSSLHLPDPFEDLDRAEHDLEEVAALRGADAAEWVQRLRALDFRGSYTRLWASPTGGIAIEIVEFDDPAAAVDFVAFEMTQTCGNKTIFDTGIPDSIGVLYPARQGDVARVQFVSGNRSVTVFGFNREGPAPRDEVIAVAQEAARRAR